MLGDGCGNSSLTMSELLNCVPVPPLKRMLVLVFLLGDGDLVCRAASWLMPVRLSLNCGCLG